MSLNSFFIGVLFFTLICVFAVLRDLYKGEDWKMTAAFMSIGWLCAVSQLAGVIK